MTEQALTSATEETQQHLPWYAIQLFGLKQKEFQTFLDNKGIESFIPMRQITSTDREGKVRHTVRPVVTNLIFIKKAEEEREILQKLERYQGQFFILRKGKTSQALYEIPSREMEEFIIMSNPELQMTSYMKEEKAKLKKGDWVIVTHGPLKGIRGRLIRHSGMYYLLKEIPGLAVMLKVTRWCCQKIEMQQQ